VIIYLHHEKKWLNSNITPTSLKKNG